MKSSKGAEQDGIHYHRTQKWFKDGRLPVPAIRTQSGTILLEVPKASAAKSALAVVYGCVSLHDQRPDLLRQVAPMAEWAASQAVIVSAVLS